MARVWSCSLALELSSCLLAGAKMSQNARFGDSVEAQVGVQLLSLSHIWDELSGSEGDEYQFDK